MDVKGVGFIVGCRGDDVRAVGKDDALELDARVEGGPTARESCEACCVALGLEGLFAGGRGVSV